jgi:low affinity Fe/Cu permease
MSIDFSSESNDEIEIDHADDNEIDKAFKKLQKKKD